MVYCAIIILGFVTKGCVQLRQNTILLTRRCGITMSTGSWGVKLTLLVIVSSDTDTRSAALY
jgi:hypothetical protein